MANIALPNQVFSSPYNGARPYGQPAHPTYNTFNPQPLPQHQQAASPQQPLQAGNMGPPSKPVDKDRPTDMNELSDVLMGSGVDLKEEEAALLGRQGQDVSGIGNSFTSAQSGPTSHPTRNSFNIYSSNVPGSRDTFYGAGILNQSAMPYQYAEEMADRAKEQSIRRRNDIKQYHLNQPFLLGRKVEQRISLKCQSEGVQMPMKGMFYAQGQQETQQIVFGPDKHERLVTLKGEALLNHDAPLGEILSLISLAAEERIHTLIEDAAALAVERRRGSSGIVPPEFWDIAAVDRAVDAAIGLPTPGNSAVSPKANPLKRMLEASRFFDFMLTQCRLLL